MPWIQATPRHRGQLEAFILSQEHYCTSLSDRLRNSTGERLQFPGADKGKIFLELSDSPPARIISLYYIERNGFSFIIFQPQRKDQKGRRRAGFNSLRSMRRLIAPELKYLFSCMGRQVDCNAFINIFNLRPIHHLNYLMMKRLPEAEGVMLQHHADWKICSGTVEDTEYLLPLHCAYVQEEVSLPGRSMNLVASTRYFRSVLQEQRVFFLEIGGAPVAKAQTNARGITVEQVGGVYTVPRLRKRGLAAQVIEYLSRRIIHDGKTVSLFVKEHNQAAIKLYQKCGFVLDSHFKILYLG